MNQPLNWTLALLSAAALSACGGGSDAGPQDVSVSFAAVAGLTPVDCSSNLSGLGTTAASGGLRDLRFYISNVKLVRDDGALVPLSLSANDNVNATVGSDAVTLIDLEDKTGSCVDSNNTEATNASINGQVPAGNYKGIRMTLGVPFAINHTDQTAGLEVTPAVINNAVNPGMAWSWGGGGASSPRSRSPIRRGPTQCSTCTSAQPAARAPIRQRVTWTDAATLTVWTLVLMPSTRPRKPLRWMLRRCWGAMM